MSTPNPHCRIGRIRFKRKSRYRSPSAFNVTTTELVRSLGTPPRPVASTRGRL